MEIPNFQEAYEIYYTNVKNEFTFTTYRGIKYIIYAFPGEGYFRYFSHPSKILYVGFHHHRAILSESRNKPDTKIMDTVLNFIFAILTDRDAVVAFNYSALGGKDIARRILFRRKYNMYNQGKHHKMDIDLAGNDVMTIIFRKDNINFAELCTMTSKDIYL